MGATARALAGAGVLVGGEALDPSGNATTLCLSDHVRDIQDEPYADIREQLGGFYVIHVPDLDAALIWAARNPAAVTGAIERIARLSYGRLLASHALRTVSLAGAEDALGDALLRALEVCPAVPARQPRRTALDHRPQPGG